MIESRDIQRFRRELRALVAKADDPEGFAMATILAEELDDALAVKANQLREANPDNGIPGYSWADLARPMGVTRQAVQQRYGRLHRASAAAAHYAGLAADAVAGGAALSRWE